ncbi:H-NS family nucleoid-associated regulatory protein [Actibacterium sp.]|uniref:H-NS histone family protein n=1 Tax=Actibacterium sp. TaxID=1872125 RepID=UPI003564CB98
MNIDLFNLSRADLQALRKDIDKAEKALAQRERMVALAAAEAAAREHGFSLAELTGAAAPAAPKYRNPENTDQTWTGRGRKPGWVAAHLAAGGALDELAV